MLLKEPYPLMWHFYYLLRPLGLSVNNSGRQEKTRLPLSTPGRASECYLTPGNWLPVVSLNAIQNEPVVPSDLLAYIEVLAL